MQLDDPNHNEFRAAVDRMDASHQSALASLPNLAFATHLLPTTDDATFLAALPSLPDHLLVTLHLIHTHFPAIHPHLLPHLHTGLRRRGLL